VKKVKRFPFLLTGEDKGANLSRKRRGELKIKTKK
jgi:hypothetical protein